MVVILLIQTHLKMFVFIFVVFVMQEHFKSMKVIYAVVLSYCCIFKLFYLIPVNKKNAIFVNHLTKVMGVIIHPGEEIDS